MDHSGDPSGSPPKEPRDPTRPADPANRGPVPDPATVFDRRGLAEQLDRFRSWDAAGAPRARVGLTELSRKTGIPRSTLHTYVSGSTLPSAEALDAIVLALGCPDELARAWGEAWERVTEAARGSYASSRTSQWSRFATLDKEVRELLTRPTDRLLDLVGPVAIAERVELGPTRQIDSVQQRVTLRALGDGADRWIMRFPVGESIGDPRRLEVTDTQHCSPGEHRYLEGPKVRVLELLLGQTLRTGETHEIEFRIDHAATRVAGGADDSSDEAVSPRTCDFVMHGFRRQGPSYTLQVCFRPDQQPRDLRQVYQDHPDGLPDKVRDLRLSPWGTVSIALEHPAAGLHGIRWSWPHAGDAGV